MTLKNSVHSHVANVYIKGGGEPREIHCDMIQSVHHGFNFIREDGSFEFISASMIDSFEVFKTAPVGGSA